MQLQQDIGLLNEWSEQCNFLFNLSKLTKSLKNPTNYAIGNIHIAKVRRQPQGLT